MRSIISKIIPVTAFFSISAFANVPVIDATTNASINALSVTNTTSNMKVLTAMSALQGTSESNAKALSNLHKALANLLVDIAKGEQQVQQIAANAERYDPSKGGKPKKSCSVLSATKSIAAGNKAKAKVVNKLASMSIGHLERKNLNNTAEDSKNDSAVHYLDNKIQELEDREAEIPVTVLGTEGIPISEEGRTEKWILLKNRMQYMAVPFPVVVEKHDKLDQLTETQLQEVSSKLIQQDRQYMVNDVIDRHVTGRTKLYDAEWVETLIGSDQSGSTVDKWMGLSLSDKLLEDLDKGIAWYDVQDMLANYRLKSPEWQIYTNAQANSEGLARDSNLMQATQLSFIKNLLDEVRQTNILLSFIYAHNIEVSGAPKPSTDR